VRREVQILMMLSGHPNIASLVGIYEDEAAVHMILELCEGGELMDEICARGTQSERDASKYFRSMVAVVQHCHTLGIMHRDIKPENFLLSKRGPGAIVKAADFGLSQFFRPGRPLHSLVGSAHFVAPEVIKRSYGPAADVWSLGVCLYVLLTGLTPFWGETEEAVLDMVLHADIDYSSPPWGAVSRQAKDIVKRMLNRNPDKRPTPSELLQHRWLCAAASDTPLDPIVVERLRSMAVAIRVKRAAMLAASQGLRPEHLPRLHAVFESLDVDRSGSLANEELAVGLQRLNLPLPNVRRHPLCSVFYVLRMCLRIYVIYLIVGAI
jgi:calcium-dependent protein kinase